MNYANDLGWLENLVLTGLNKGGLNLSEIWNLLHTKDCVRQLHRSAVSRSLSGLLKAGLVEKRGSVYWVTEQGANKVQALFTLYEQLYLQGGRPDLEN